MHDLGAAFYIIVPIAAATVVSSSDVAGIVMWLCVCASQPCQQQHAWAQLAKHLPDARPRKGSKPYFTNIKDPMP
jgi:hypothetical protein